MYKIDLSIVSLYKRRKTGATLLCFYLAGRVKTEKEVRDSENSNVPGSRPDLG